MKKKMCKKNLHIVIYIYYIKFVFPYTANLSHLPTANS